MPTLTAIAANLAQVRERIERACDRARRDPESVTLIGVTKTQPPEAVLAAWEAGLRDFGENYVQEALAKIEAVSAALGGRLDGPRFHFIGHLQRNKAREAASAFAILHAVDSERLIDAIAAARPPVPVKVMLHVNIASEASKNGAPVAALPALAAHARAVSAVELRGLMAIPPLSPDPEASRPWFRELRELAGEHGLSELSMGMTGDFEAAIEEGATHVRVGRAIFGERR